MIYKFRRNYNYSILYTILRMVGSYGALEGGFAGEAFEDFCGGLLEKRDLGEPGGVNHKYSDPRKMTEQFTRMLDYHQRASLMSASIMPSKVFDNYTYFLYVIS